MNAFESLFVLVKELKEIAKEELNKFQWKYRSFLREGDFLRTKKPLYLSTEPTVQKQKTITSSCFYVLELVKDEKEIFWVQCLTDYGIFWIKQESLLEYRIE